MTPSPRAALAAGLVAASALVLPGGLVAVLLLVLAGAVVGDALAVRRPPEVERSFPTSLARGVGAPLVARVSGERTGTVRLRQPATPALAVAVADDAGDVLEAVVRPRHRGRHQLPPLFARSTGPLGLGRWDHRVADAQDVAVYPDLPTARALAVAVRRGLARDLARLTRGALGLGTELERVRDYQPDDELRQVNWRATARLGRPMSNEHRLDEDRDVLCVVDAGRLMGAPLGERTRLDVALDAVAAVGLVADVAGDRCGTIAFDDRIRRLVKPRRAGGRAVVDALFDLEPSNLDSAYELAFRTVGGGKRACVVVLTDLVDEAAARSLVDAVPVLARRHAVVVATAVDDDLQELLRRPPATAFDVHAAAVAADVLAARSAVVASLRAGGAVVVEAPAGGLGRACVAAYLSQKARARL